MSDKYIPMDIDNNVRVAVKKLREAYWSNDTERYAQQFVRAEEIIISSICHHGYTVVKECESGMKQIAKVLGRLIGVLICEGVITQEEGNLILEPLKEGKAE